MMGSRKTIMNRELEEECHGIRGRRAISRLLSKREVICNHSGNEQQRQMKKECQNATSNVESHNAKIINYKPQKR
jgi:hypothetical protein